MRYRSILFLSILQPCIILQNKYVCLVLKYNLLIGALVHTRCDGGKKAYAFVDLHQFPHDSNLTIAISLNVLQDTNARAQVLYLQLDNCYRENNK